jgi:hypothetical protein
VNGDSLPTGSFLHGLPYRIDLVALIVFLTTPLTNRVGTTVSNSTSIVACVTIAAGTCLPSRCLEMDVVSGPFASNGCFSGSTVLALSKYAAIILGSNQAECDGRHIEHA